MDRLTRFLVDSVGEPCLALACELAPDYHRYVGSHQEGSDDPRQERRRGLAGIAAFLDQGFADRQDRWPENLG